MSDCADLEMRESLPELLHGRLGPEDRDRVAAHVASCEECAAELELLRAARGAFARMPAIDTARIAAAVARASRARAARSGWHRSSWRMAAAISVISLGGISLARARAAFDRPQVAAHRAGPAPRTSAPAQATAPLASAAPVTSSRSGSVTVASPEPVESAGRGERPSLSFGGGLHDLSDDELRALIGAVERIDARPSTEPEHIAPPGASSGELE